MTALRERAIEMYQDGSTIHTISHSLGVEYTIANHWLRDLIAERERASHTLGRFVRVASDVLEDNAGRDPVEIAQETVLSECLWATRGDALAQAAVRGYVQARRSRGAQWWLERSKRPLFWWLDDIAAYERRCSRAAA